MNLVNVIRKARKIYRDENNPIETIRSIRTTTGVGLKAAKDFWDWMGKFNGMSATRLAEWWCKDHWCPIGNCGCAVKKELAEANATGAGTSGVTKPVFDDGLPEPIPPKHRAKATAKPKPEPSASALIEANKDRCPCRQKPCTDEFHANLSALIRKYGSTRAVELVWIAAGVKAPENEEQARFVEAQPGYKPFYKEQEQ